MSSDILNENDFEGLRLFEEESEISQITSSYLKEIVGNLFKNTDVNVEDFHYMIFDDEQPNAFFISSKGTKDNKNIVAVSRGLFDVCQNEAELAGIIGHECGHYLWGNILGGRNTIWQEHIADLRAVDLMMNAGFKGGNSKEYKYNPRHHLAICGRIFSDYGRSRFSDISIGVHGNGLARVEDIKDYMTKIANEQGDFPPISEEVDIKYNSIKSKVKYAYEKDGYDTYLDKCFKKKYGTKDLDKISIENVMSTMIEEISSDRITPKHHARFNQVMKIINEYSKNGLYDTKSEQLTKLCRDFFEVTRENIDRNVPYNKDEKPQDTLKVALRQFKLEIYGDFAKQMDNVNHFVNYKDMEDAVHWAKEMYQLSWTSPYSECFTNAHYESLTAKREDNVGKALPWDELSNFIRDGNLTKDDAEALSWAKDKVCSREGSWNRHLYSFQSYNISKEDEEKEKHNNHKDFYYVEDGKVVAFGHEAIKRHKMDRFNSDTQRFLYECKRSYEQFNRNIAIYDELSTFAKEDSTKEEKSSSKQNLIEIFREYASPHDGAIRLDDNNLVYFSDYYAGYNPANVRNPYVDEITERYKSSKMKDAFISNEDAEIRTMHAKERYKEKQEKIEKLNKNISQDSDVQEALLNIEDEYKINEIADATNIRYNTGFHKKTVLSLIRFAKEVYAEDPKLSCQIFEIAKEKITVGYSEIGKKELGYVDKDGKIYDEERNIIAYKRNESELVDEHGDVIGYIDRSGRGYKHNDTYIKRDYELNRDDLENVYYREVLDYPLMLDSLIKRTSYSYGETTKLDNIVLPEIHLKNQTKHPLLEKAMATAGFNPYATLMENLTNLNNEFGKKYSIIDYRSYHQAQIEKEADESIFELSASEFGYIRSLGANPDNMRKKEFLEQAGILMLANSIKKGENYDIRTVMNYLKFSKGSSSYSPEITDMLAEDIQKNNRFKNLPLEDKIFVYETMEELNLFSEKKANKIEFFKSITKEIISSQYANSVEYAEKLLSREFVTLKKDNALKHQDIEFAKEKDLLIDFYAKSLSDSLGIDDGSDIFLAKATNVADKVCELRRKDYRSEEYRFSRDIRSRILRKISDNIISQELTAQMLDEKGLIKVSGEDAEKYDEGTRACMAVFSVLAKDPDKAKNVVEFLSMPFTNDSAEKLLDVLDKDHELRQGKKINISDQSLGLHFNHQYTLDKGLLQLAHENFWHADLPVRAYVMKRVLKAYTNDCTISYEERNKIKKEISKSLKREDVDELVGIKAKELREKKETDKKLDLVVNMYFDKKSPYYDDAKKVIHAVYNNLQDYEKDLILGALVSASTISKEGKDTTQESAGEKVGEGLRMFFENKGPAFVKFGQLLSYLPSLNADIRKPLAKLRDKADIPSRADVFKMMKETLPDDELKNITKVGKILGAGSFFITAQIKYKNKDCVVSLMRPHAQELVSSGMQMIRGTISELSSQDSKYEALQNIAEQAENSSKSEVNIREDYAKFVNATKIYDDLNIVTESGEFRTNVAKWQAWGTGKDGLAYKIMDLAPGKAMTSQKMSEKEKHDMAVAYTTVELCNLLSGQRWDTDRHQGQQNLAEEGMGKFVIGIFDTGAQMQNNPTTKDKMLLGELLYGMARAARNGESIADYMLSKVKSIDSAGKKLNFNVKYIDEVQRGLTALSDIMTYQKETRDEKGNVTQEAKSLSSKELGQITNAILASGLVDKKIKMTLKAKAILNKLRFFRKGWVSSLSEGLSPITSTIRIEKNEGNNIIGEVQRHDKPQVEIERLGQEENTKRKLGVSIEHIVEKSQNGRSL